METYDKEILKHLKPAFEAVPVYDYLVNLNKEIKLGRKYQ
jgi:hypothetical protein